MRERSLAEPARARWSIVALLAVALFINYVDRGAVPSAAHLLQADLHLAPHHLGLLFSAFFWTYALLQIPIGWAAERLGAARVLGAGLALWACATLLTGASHSFGELLGLRLLLGVGESVGFPSVSKLLASVVPIASLGRANGLVSFGYLFGPAVGAYGGGALMVHIGWRGMFYVLGALSLLWLIPWSFVRLAPAAQRTVNGPGWGALLRQRALWGTTLGHFASNYTFYFMLTWLPYYLVKVRGLSTAAMAGVVGSAYLVNAASAFLAGWFADRAVRAGHGTFAYKSMMLIALIGAVACMLCIGLGSAPLALGAIFVFQVLLGMSSPGTFAISQILAGPGATARWIGVQNALANVSGIIAPAVAGYLADANGGFAAAFVIAAGVSALGVFGWLGLVPLVEPLDWSARTARGSGPAGP
ncbi:MAG: MFS transporter [Gammaproteobacteria bacterium]|nr:MFS transporter [Gammaproteobacteria bacterium]MBV9620755.1 MFS transporter [Gammaproteobacteria bacterium]